MPLGWTLRVLIDIYQLNSALLPDDFAMIREYLQRRTQLTIEARTKIGRKLATQVKQVIMQEPLPKKVAAEEFLEAVYLACQDQRSRS